MQLRNGRATLWKTARGHLLWSGLSAGQALHLECACLHRLTRAVPLERPHFPQLVGLEPAQHRFEITHQGLTVRSLVAAGRRLAIPDVETQLSRIAAGLRSAGVIHLDMHADGRNLTVASDGHVSVIDFDIAAIDGVAFSGAIAKRLARFEAESGFEGFCTRMRSILGHVIV